MKFLSILTTFAAFLFFSISSSAQSMYMQPGQGAVILQAQAQQNSDQNTLSIGLGSSIKGYVDLGADLVLGKMNEYAGYQGVKETGVSPYVNILWLKQNRGYSPVTLFSGARYSTISYRSTHDTDYLNGSRSCWTVQSGIAHHVDLSYQTGIMPTLSVSYSRQATYIDNMGPTGTSYFASVERSLHSVSSTSEYGLTASLPLLIGTPGGSRFLIEPSYSYSNINQQLHIKIGMLLAPNARKCKGGMCPVFR